MKIGLIIPGFSPSIEDIAIPVQHHLVQRLSKVDEVHVFPIRYPHKKRPYNVGAARVHPQGGGTLAGLARFGLMSQTVQAISIEHERRSFDVLHAMWADEPGYAAVTAGRKLELPVVVSLLGGELVRMEDIRYGAGLSMLNRMFVSLALKQADRVLAGSSYQRNLVANRVGPSRLINLPLGVETDLFGPAEQREVEETSNALPGDPCLIHVASLIPVKAQRTLLRAFVRILEHYPEASLNLVGGGPLRKTLEQQASTLGILDRTVFHGSVPHDQLPAYLAQADLQLLASRHEGQELTTLEAAACGVPTVGTRVGLLPDLVPPEWTAAPKDPIGLAEAALNALANPGRLKTERQALQKRVLKEFSLKETVKRLRTLYVALQSERNQA